VGRASARVALDCGGKRSATPLSLPVKSAWFNPLRHFNPKRRRASLAAAVHTCGARYLGDFVTSGVVVGKRCTIETANAPRAGLAGWAGGDASAAAQGASREWADTRQWVRERSDQPAKAHSKALRVMTGVVRCPHGATERTKHEIANVRKAREGV
jgi:hypothetical protein